MTVRHFRISRTSVLPLGRAWRITETDGDTDKAVQEFSQCHLQRETALAALAYGMVAEIPGPIVVHISELTDRANERHGTR